MDKILRISLIIIYSACWFIAAYVVFEEIGARTANLFTIDHEVNDYSLLFPFLVFVFGIPSVLFLFTKARNQVKKLNKWQKLSWISNFGLGLTMIYFSIDIFIMIQEKFPVKELPQGWDRYLIGLGFIIFGTIIIYQNFKEKLATTKINTIKTGVYSSHEP